MSSFIRKLASPTILSPHLRFFSTVHGHVMKLPEPPSDFPFVIKDIPGRHEVKLRREFAGEKIVVEVEKPDCESRDVVEREIQIYFDVNVFKGNGNRLSIYCHGENCGSIGEGVAYFHTGENVCCPDLHRDKFWKEFVTMRGLEESTVQFLIEYMTKKEHRDYLLFLKKIRSFIN